MRWLVDGYNVIRGDPDLRGAEEQSLERARAALLRLVAMAAERSGDQFTVVFDGAPRGGSAPASGRIEVRFSRAPQKADDVLVAEARRLREGAIVVTSDRMVQEAARRAGTTAVPAQRFVAALDRLHVGDDVGDDAGEDEDDDDAAAPKRGNPRRLSKDERAVRRALARLSRQ